MPNALRVFIHFTDAMERHTVHLAFRIHQLKGRGALVGKRQLFQRDQNDPVLCPVVITQLKVPFSKLGIRLISVDSLRTYVMQHEEPAVGCRNPGDPRIEQCDI